MIPAKPFPAYKWRWLSLEPTENLLQAPIFLGVLRALAKHEDDRFTSEALWLDLAKVELDTSSPVKLARSQDRNLIRNSGQYWRGTGLLVPQRGVISLTALGHRVAAGQITQGEFASLMIQQTVLPNPATYKPADFDQWVDAGLQIRPLKLILEVMEALGRATHVTTDASLTNSELVRVVIPLAGTYTAPNIIAQQLIDYRLGQLDLTGWPDCAPDSNDRRLAREFLLFLANFGVLRHDADGGRDEQRFFLPELFSVDEAVEPIGASIFEGEEDEAIAELRDTILPAIVERQRTLVQVLARPQQAAFRADVMQLFGSRCVITNETIPQILEAAHIIPVSENGSDNHDNGLCMRIDIHRLFDSGNLRIKPDGRIEKSEVLTQSQNYEFLPGQIVVPQHVGIQNLTWRDSYL